MSVNTMVFTTNRTVYAIYAPPTALCIPLLVFTHLDKIIGWATAQLPARTNILFPRTADAKYLRCSFFDALYRYRLVPLCRVIRLPLLTIIFNGDFFATVLSDLTLVKDGDLRFETATYFHLELFFQYALMLISCLIIRWFRHRYVPHA